MADNSRTNTATTQLSDVASSISGILTALGLDPHVIGQQLIVVNPPKTPETGGIDRVFLHLNKLLKTVNADKYLVAETLQHAANEAIDALTPKNNYGNWFKDKQTAIEKILEARRAKPGFYISAIWGAEQNPRANGLANYATNWYAAHAAVSIGTARRTLKTAEWVYSSKEIEGSRKEKLAEKRQRQILVEQMTLSGINSVIGRISSFEIASEQTKLLENTIKKVGPQARFKELHPALSVEENKMRNQHGIEKPATQDRAFLHTNYDGSANLRVTLSRLTHAKMRAAMGSIDSNSFTQWVTSRLTGRTPDHDGVKLALIINAKDYPNLVTSDQLTCQSNVGIRINARDVIKDINEIVPVVLKGQHTTIPGMLENPDARFASTSQREALAYRNCYCAYPDCRKPAHFGQAHHVLSHAAGGKTSTDNLIMLCHKHHGQNDDSRSSTEGGHFEIDGAGIPYWQPHAIGAARQYNQHILYHCVKTKQSIEALPP